jgi:hypothetical protein
MHPLNDILSLVAQDHSKNTNIEMSFLTETFEIDYGADLTFTLT